MAFLDLFRRTQTRATFDRTNADLLVNDPNGFPSSYPPVWWVGVDSGGGALPIGPHGPWEYGIRGPGSIPAVIRATALITGPLTAAPFRVLSTDVGGPPAPIPRWLSDPMLMRPDERVGGQVYPEVVQLPRGQFWSAWIRSAIWWGMGAFIFTSDATGAPMAGTLRNVDPRSLSTERDVNGALCWVLGDNGTDTGTRVRFDRDGYVTIGGITYRIIVLRNPHSPVDKEGISRGVFELSPGTFHLGSQIGDYESGQFRSGVPNGYLKVTAPDLAQPEADTLRKEWLAKHGGDRRSIAVLNATTEFHPLNLSPVDTALAESKRLNIADVAFAFGLDPMTLGAAINTSGTYTNLQDAWQNHRDFGLGVWIGAVQDTLSAIMPGGQSVSVNLDGFANPPAKDRFAAYQTALTAGILTLNEVRSMEGLPPLEGNEDA